MPEDFEFTPTEDVSVHPVSATQAGGEIVPAETAYALAPPPDPAREPFWGYSDLAIVVGLMFAFLMALVLGIIAIYRGVPPVNSPRFLLGTQLAVYAMLLAAFKVVITLRHQRPLLASLGWRRSTFNLAFAATGGILLAFAISAVALALHTPKIDSVIEEMLRSKSMLIWFGALAVTLAPFFEELFFRGFLQPLFSRTFGLIAGVLITAILFGTFHGPEYQWAWQYLFAVTLVGVALGVIRARSNSIIPTTVMHACYNGVFVVAASLAKHT